MAITKPITINHQPAFVGQVADIEIANTISKLNKGSTVLEAGVAVQSDGADGAKAMSSGAKFMGVVVREMNHTTPDNGTIGIQAHKTGTVMTMGSIWVKAGEAVAYGDPVFAGVGTDVAGMFTKAAGASGTLAVEVKNATFVGSASKKGDLVRISITIGG